MLRSGISLTLLRSQSYTLTSLTALSAIPTHRLSFTFQRKNKLPTSCSIPGLKLICTSKSQINRARKAWGSTRLSSFSSAHSRATKFQIARKSQEECYGKRRAKLNSNYLHLDMDRRWNAPTILRSQCFLDINLTHRRAWITTSLNVT